jgi:hypothetical protein
MKRKEEVQDSRQNPISTSYSTTGRSFNDSFTMPDIKHRYPVKAIA